MSKKEKITEVSAPWGFMKKIQKTGFLKGAILYYGRKRIYTNHGDEKMSDWKLVKPKNE